MFKVRGVERARSTGLKGGGSPGADRFRAGPTSGNARVTPIGRTHLLTRQHHYPPQEQRVARILEGYVDSSPCRGIAGKYHDPPPPRRGNLPHHYASPRRNGGQA